MLKAVIFDMDGVIIDSEPQHARAAILALQKYKVSISIDYAYNFIGTTTYHMCKKMLEDFKLTITPEELLAANEEMKEQLHKTEGVVVIPYIIDLMKNLHENKIRLIIASSSSAKAIEEVMDVCKLHDYFEGYVSGMMVTHPKPAPDIFLLAAKRLGVDPSDCIVIEDSYHGVTAAAAAGITSIGFINPNSGKQDLRQAAMLIEGFDEVDYNFVNHVYQYAHMEPLTILETEHFHIKEIALEDIEALCKLYEKPEISIYVDDFSFNLAHEKEKLEAYIKNIYHYYGFGLWGVYFKESNQLVGRCGVELKMLEQEEVYELGYLLDPTYQGHGYAKEFVVATIKHCFEQLGITRIVTLIVQNNTRSIRLAEIIGMHKIGETIRKQRHCYKYMIQKSC